MKAIRRWSGKNDVHDEKRFYDQDEKRFFGRDKKRLYGNDEKRFYDHDQVVRWRALRHLGQLRHDLSSEDSREGDESHER